ncbi:MAG: Hsp20/alpha crystallin family protein [Clostridia bacterium]
MMTMLMPYHTNRHPVTHADFGPFDDFFRPFFVDGSNSQLSLRVDVKDEGDHYTLAADLPGIKKEDVSIEIEEGVLTISAEVNRQNREEKDHYVYNERLSGKVSRSFTLSGIDESAISAACEDGVLRLTLPKQAEEVKNARKIAIQ